MSTAVGQAKALIRRGPGVRRTGGFDPAAAPVGPGGVTTTYLLDADSVHPPLALETQRPLEVE
eukprot:13886048-Heterocapsa_arctica.AAC.1